MDPTSVPEPTRHAILTLAEQYRFFHWHLEFADVFHLKGGFDAVLGNPPFVNAIEGAVPGHTRRLVRHTHAHIGGTADLAYYFLSASSRLVRRGGRVGLVQPRAVLNASAAQEFRATLPTWLRANLLYAPGRSDLFAGAAVFIALVVLGPDDDCRVSRGDDPATAIWVTGALRSSNWWLAIEALVSGEDRHTDSSGPSVGEIFTVVASMTTGDAYDVVPFVVDDQGGSWPKLVTTGLIDPEICKWGEARCRYLKRDYQFPRVAQSADMTKSLKQRHERSRRPKVLVAGLSKRIECFLDQDGEFIGAVSTFSIFHPQDDVTQLHALSQELLSDGATRRFISELGGNAMGGGNTTMRKSFLSELPFPITEPI